VIESRFPTPTRWSRDISANVRHFRDVDSVDTYLAVAGNLARPYVAQASPSTHLKGPTAIPALNHLHPEILRVSGALFTNGHMGEAVFAALKAVEMRVRSQAGRSANGQALMAQAFAGSEPVIDLGTTTSTHREDEQKGFQLIFMGAMLGIRNLGAHDFPSLDERLAGDYLAFASLLLNRLEAGRSGSRRSDVDSAPHMGTKPKAKRTAARGPG
jgi:uncharacterized protein (TIGR02391 family)